MPTFNKSELVSNHARASAFPSPEFQYVYRPKNNMCFNCALDAFIVCWLLIVFTQ